MIEHKYQNYTKQNKIVQQNQRFWPILGIKGHVIYHKACTIIQLKPQSLEFNGDCKALFEPILNQNKPNKKQKIAQTIS